MDVKRILFPVDLSGFSSNIVQQVISVAEKFGAEILVVAVIEPPETSYPHHFPPDQLNCDILEKAEQELKLFEFESFVNYRNMKSTLLCGQPAEEILKYISSSGVDLVIMATHRRKGEARAVLGSIADEVIRKSPVPVMSINPEKRELGWRVSRMSPEEKLRLRPDWEGAKTGTPIE
jgi:nucleotide-binding universal stress UspA family protein